MIGSKIIQLIKVDSTNNYARGIIGNREAEEGTVVLAYNQFSGRGQKENQWESEPGKNLTFSIILYPDFLKNEQQYLISKIISLGICTLLQRYINNNIRIKWPNDIYIKNKKIGGILIENSVMHEEIYYCIAGIGLNINQDMFGKHLYNPVSLKIITGKEFETEELLRQLLAIIDEYYSRLRKGKIKSIDDEFNSRLYLIDKMARFSDKKGEFNGMILGVNEFGQLLIDKEDKNKVCYSFKEVEFID